MCSWEDELTRKNLNLSTIRYQPLIKWCFFPVGCINCTALWSNSHCGRAYPSGGNEIQKGHAGCSGEAVLSPVVNQWGWCQMWHMSLCQMHFFLALKIKEKSGSPEGADTGYCVWGNRNPGGGIGTLCLFLGLFKQLSSLRQYGRNKSLTKHCWNSSGGTEKLTGE